MLQIAGKPKFKCKLRYLEAPKQAHLIQETLHPINKYYLSEP